jgi:hypothetical protein
MTFTAIVTAHDMDPSRILGNVMYQTRKADEILCLASDITPIDFKLLQFDFPGVTFVLTENREDWGHEKRAIGVDLAKSDSLGFFNADDSYDIHYIERMMAELEAGADAAYCGWNKIPYCAFALGSSTSGNFIVKTHLARRVGYTDRHYEADGTFIEKLRENANVVAYVDDLLYFHNFQ